LGCAWQGALRGVWRGRGAGGDAGGGICGFEGGGGFGGAIFNDGGVLTVTNSTFTANSAIGGSGYGAGSGLGGAIFNLNGTVKLQFSTLAGNTVAAGTGGITVAAGTSSITGGVGYGGAVYSLGYNLQAGQAAALTLDDTILSNSNSALGTPSGTLDLVVDAPSTIVTAPGNPPNAATSTVTFLDQNLIEAYEPFGNASITPGSSITSSTDPGLGHLAINNHGLTATMAITAASPAFEAATCEPSITTVDQNGTARPQGSSGKCSIGAYEPIPTVPVTLNTSPQGVPLTVSGSAGCSPGNYSGGVTLQWNPSLQCTVSFNAPSGYTFAIWSDNNQSNPRTFQAPAAATSYTANFYLTTTITPQGLITTYQPTTAQTLTLTANVKSALTINGGTVFFSVGNVGTATSGTVTGGVATATLNVPAGVPAGAYPITAVFSGTATFAPSIGPAISAPINVVINPASQSINSFTVSPSAQVVGGAVTLTATASSNLPVTFSASPASVCSYSTTGIVLTAIGTCTVTAAQGGNGNYSAAASILKYIAVNGDPQSINFPGLPTETVGTQAALSASASSGLPVSFTTSTPLTCLVSAAGASYSVSFVAAGSCSITPAQAGNSRYVPVTGTAQIITVVGKPQSISFPGIASHVQGTIFSLNATASSGLAVTYASTTPGVCSVAGTNVTALNAGTCTITASQNGSSTYAAAATVSQSFIVTAAFKLSAIPSSLTTFGTTATYVIELQSASNVTGTISVSCSGGPAGSQCRATPGSVQLLSGSGLVTATVTLPRGVSPGSYPLTFTGTLGSLSNSTSATLVYQ